VAPTPLVLSSCCTTALPLLPTRRSSDLDIVLGGADEFRERFAITAAGFKSQLGNSRIIAPMFGIHPSQSTSHIGGHSYGGISVKSRRDDADHPCLSGVIRKIGRAHV